jgi:leader peptidase (prepilin peptidase)/N-methyltransferase
LWRDNIPLLSYLLLSGRCRHCKANISRCYFLVELLTAILFLCIYLHTGISWVFAAYALFVSGLIVATFVDFEHRIIPDEVSVGGMFAGIILSFFIPGLHDTSAETLSIGRIVMAGIIGICILKTVIDFFISKGASDAMDITLLVIISASLWTGLGINAHAGKLMGTPFEFLIPNLLGLDAALIGYLTGAGAIYVLGVIGDIIFKRESMGGGDVKLLAMIGAFLGWKAAILTFFIAPIFGAVPGIIIKIRTKESVVAYGPALVAGALLSLFWGDRLIRWFLSGYGLF